MFVFQLLNDVKARTTKEEFGPWVWGRAGLFQLKLGASGEGPWTKKSLAITRPQSVKIFTCLHVHLGPMVIYHLGSSSTSLDSLSIWALTTLTFQLETLQGLSPYGKVSSLFFLPCWASHTDKGSSPAPSFEQGSFVLSCKWVTIKLKPMQLASNIW